MEKAVLRVRRLMSCLGDPSRFRIVRALLERERCVTELAAAVGLSQSCTTRHLQALQREGLARGRRDGKRVMFRLCSDEPRVSALLRWATRGGKLPDAARAPRSPRANGKVSSRAGVPANGSRRAAIPAKASIEANVPPAIEELIHPPVDDAPNLVSPSAPAAEEPEEETASRPLAPRQDLEDYLL
jgi:DNA-binding transcriptional ArsR family regulator